MQQHKTIKDSTQTWIHSLERDTIKWLETKTDSDLIRLRNRKNSAVRVGLILAVAFAVGVFVGVSWL